MEFEFKDIAEDDFHGVKSLVSLVATGPLAELISLTDPICNQQNVGCVVTAEGGESGICAFGTVINIIQHKSNPGAAAVHALLKEIVKKNSKSSKPISRMMSSADNVIGLLLKERLINFPPELAPNIHEVLIGDVKWSASDEYEPDEGEKREDYQFSHILLLSTYEIEAGRGASAGPVDESEAPVASVQPEGLAHKQKRKMDKASAKLARVYLHWEDEILVERAGFSHTWQNTGKPTVVRSGRKYQSFSILYGLRWADYVDLVATLPKSH